MRIFLSICLLLGVLSSCSTGAPDIEFTIQPESGNESQRLKIHLSTSAGANGETQLTFPNDAWGQEDLYNAVVSMEVVDEQATIEKNTDSGWIVIRHRPDLDRLEFEYILEQDFDGPILSRVDSRPIIQQDYFHVFSHSLFMLPEHVFEANEDAVDISLEWKDFPPNHVFLNSFGSGESQQTIRSISENDFNTAVFTGGDMRSYDININGNEVVFGIRGDWEVFQDSSLVDVLSKTIKAQRDFWRDHSQEYFAVTMIPTAEEQGYSYHGTGLTNSFALTASNNEYLDVTGLVYLMNHELQHNWIGHVIKNDNEEEQYWFSEGFTEYYTLKNIATYNIYDLDTAYFINEFNALMRELYTSSVKEAPNEEINYDNFWSSRDYSRLPYLRGALFAFYLDYKIVRASNGTQSLDDLMLRIAKDASEKDQLLTHAYFLEVVGEYFGEDLRPFFTKHIEEGKPMDLASIYTEFGFEFEPETKVFYLGFTFTEDQAGVATVDPDSKAYQAGLRPGDTLGRRSIWHGSLTHTADFTVLRNGKEEPVSFLPVATKQIPQLLVSEQNTALLSF